MELHLRRDIGTLDLCDSDLCVFYTTQIENHRVGDLCSIPRGLGHEHRDPIHVQPRSIGREGQDWVLVRLFCRGGLVVVFLECSRVEGERVEGGGFVV